MIQQKFATKAVEILKTDKSVIGLAVGGSWLTNELDQFSDLDLILVTKSKISDRKSSVIKSLEMAVLLFYDLRKILFTSQITFQHETEIKVLEYFEKIKLNQIK